MMNAITAADRQKAKLAMLFSALGLVGFLLNILAGVWLWSYSASRVVEVPTYDRFVGQLRVTDASSMPRLATAMYEKWSACASTHSGMNNVAVHALITSSIIAIALFALCLLFTIQVYAALGRAVTSEAAPQPPDPVDDTWRT
jgi:hypothetical protein